jgi:hypothetical protein
MKFYLKLLIPLVVVLLGCEGRGDGFRDVYVKSVSMNFVLGGKVTAEISKDGGLGSLVIERKNEKITVPDEFLSGLNGVDLQTLRVQVEGVVEDDAKVVATSILLDYGDSLVWLDGKESDKIILHVNGRIKFLISGGRVVARYRAQPEEANVGWEVFIKVRGEPEIADYTTKGPGCPLTGLATIEAGRGRPQ